VVLFNYSRFRLLPLPRLIGFSSPLCWPYFRPHQILLVAARSGSPESKRVSQSPEPCRPRAGHLLRRFHCAGSSVGSLLPFSYNSVFPIQILLLGNAPEQDQAFAPDWRLRLSRSAYAIGDATISLRRCGRRLYGMQKKAAAAAFPECRPHLRQAFHLSYVVMPHRATTFAICSAVGHHAPSRLPLFSWVLSSAGGAHIDIFPFCFVAVRNAGQFIATPALPSASRWCIWHPPSDASAPGAFL